MADQSITCPACSRRIPLTRALRAEIETSLKDEYDRRLDDERGRLERDAAARATRQFANDLSALIDAVRLIRCVGRGVALGGDSRGFEGVVHHGRVLF